MRKAHGNRSEEAVLTALRRSTRPRWIVSARPGTTPEDRRGIDVVVETLDCGTLYLQVKSSEEEAEKHRAKTWRDPIGLVVVLPHDDRNTIYGKVLGALILCCEASPLFHDK